LGFTAKQSPEFRFQSFNFFSDWDGLFELLKGYLGKRVGLHGNPVTLVTGTSQADCDAGDAGLSRYSDASFIALNGLQQARLSWLHGDNTSLRWLAPEELADQGANRPHLGLSMPRILLHPPPGCLHEVNLESQWNFEVRVGNVEVGCRGNSDKKDLFDEFVLDTAVP
jgi:hypothetical protein